MLRLTVLVALGLLLLAGCGGAMRGAPPAGARISIDLNGRVPLKVELPRGYEVQSETSATFDVFHVWRVPPMPLERDTALAIFMGQPITAYCRKQEGSYLPAAFRQWVLRWHHCAAGGGGSAAGGTAGMERQVWETHVLGAGGPLHIFVIGNDLDEAKRLRAIAESLTPKAGPTPAP